MVVAVSTAAAAVVAAECDGLVRVAFLRVGKGCCVR